MYVMSQWFIPVFRKRLRAEGSCRPCDIQDDGVISEDLLEPKRESESGMARVDVKGKPCQASSGQGRFRRLDENPVRGC